ncbi:hypothetical protein HY839_02710 [Candidatus Azambacteria bacterium]|nr:hypothetical protein [Candidatus Azambacteria bacterium]
MPFQPVQSDPEYHSFQRRQSFLWVALLGVVLLIGGVVFLIAYQLMRGGGGNGGAPSAVVMPAVNAVASIIRGEAVSQGDYFLMSEVSSTDKRLRIFKVYYAPFSKEEIFAIPWRDGAAAPVVAEYGENLAVFLDSGRSIVITREGKTVSLSNSFFVPEDPHFTISPDGKKMVYFKQFSSLGTKSLTIRDLEKNEDVFGWPINSPASETCDFSGWSADGGKAYCTSVKNGRVMVKAVDVRRYSYAVAASFSGVRDAQFYPAHALVVAADKQSIFTFDITTKEKKDVLALAGEAVESVFLAPDRSKIVFTAGGAVHAVGLDGSGKKEIDHATRILSLLPDGARALVEVSEDGGAHYAIIGIDEESHAELGGITKDIVHAQFIGWFSGGVK